MDFSGKVAIVTGGAGGIGLGTAEAFLAAGASVVLADVDDQAGPWALERLGDSGRTLFVAMDVADEAAVAAMVEQAVARFGRIDFLINNAGISRNKPLAELTLSDWQRVLGTNLTGAMLCAKYAAAQLRQAKGAIVNIASTRALMSEANTEAYSASKGGIVALTHALAVSLSPAVRVNCISPGWIVTQGYHRPPERPRPPLSDTDNLQHPAGRAGVPADVAQMVLYLCSDAAGFITGQNFVIDGGMTKKMIYME
jgi:NAD(P)-dependent dehydrogenase (short-subunit alcohol dehydrogenase family)